MDSKFIACVKQQMNMHPSMEPQDMYKLCYQVAFGAEHMLLDEERAWRYLQAEFEQVKPDLHWPLVEWLSEGVARVNLSTYKAKGLPLELLFELFVEGARGFDGSEEELDLCIGIVTEMAANGELGFQKQEWQAFCEGRPLGPVHHSQNYKLKEEPAYRVIRGQSVRRIDDLVG
ncbi:MAG: hypothetical protein IJW63_05630 [Lachnospiraceae bacterium]|nr:hypothetical protein [Lachnospiraceae bacterium]